MSKKNRFYLECPYQEKDKCKKEGGQRQFQFPIRKTQKIKLQKSMQH